MLKVAVLITTYNLEEYIAEAIESVLCQKTDFDFEIYIADDCSQDGTLKILRDYETKYPNKIKVFPSDVNMGSLANSNRLFDGIKSEYVTFLDGDDYWLDENRLQMQVEYMDANPDCFMCAGNTQYLTNGKLADLLVEPKYLNKKFTFNDMLNGNMPFFHTSSILLRNSIFVHGLPSCFKEVIGTFEECALRGEDFRRILHLEKGYLYAMNSLMSVYRIHDKGVWQGASQLKKMIEGAICYNFYAKYFGDKYGDFFLKCKEDSYRSLIKHLIIKEGFLESYNLAPQESILLNGLLNDISINRNNENSNRMSKIKMYILKKLLRNL